MRRWSPTRRVLLAVAVLGVIGTGTAAVAVATSTSSGNAFAGCLSDEGFLYNVRINPTAPPRCLHHSTAITWNQTGPPGAPGVNGTDGTNGTNGKDGTNGKTVLNGTGAPSSALGTDGDFYIDTAANTIYGPKSAGAWGSPASLVGPRGPAGPAGPASVTDQQFGPISVPTGDVAGLIEDCPTGSVALSGGMTLTPAAVAGLAVTDSEPVLSGGTPIGWQMNVVNNSGITVAWTMHIMCAPTTTGASALAHIASAGTARTTRVHHVKARVRRLKR